MLLAPTFESMDSAFAEPRSNRPLKILWQSNRKELKSRILISFEWNEQNKENGAPLTGASMGISLWFFQSKKNKIKSILVDLLG